MATIEFSVYGSLFDKQPKLSDATIFFADATVSKLDEIKSNLESYLLLSFTPLWLISDKT